MDGTFAVQLPRSTSRTRPPAHTYNHRPDNSSCTDVDWQSPGGTVAPGLLAIALVSTLAGTHTAGCTFGKILDTWGVELSLRWYSRQYQWPTGDTALQE